MQNVWQAGFHSLIEKDVQKNIRYPSTDKLATILANDV